MINRFPDMDTYFTEINHVLLASQGLAVIFSHHQVCVIRRREDTLFVAQSESRISAFFFASKTV
jgi:hypothetical protein